MCPNLYTTSKSVQGLETLAEELSSIKHLIRKTKMNHALFKKKNVFVFICAPKPTVMKMLAYICTQTPLMSAVMSSEDTLPHFHLEKAMWAGCLYNAAMKQMNLIFNFLKTNHIRPLFINILTTHLRRLNKYAARLSRLCKDKGRRAHDRAGAAESAGRCKKQVIKECSPILQSRRHVLL